MITKKKKDLIKEHGFVKVDGGFTRNSERKWRQTSKGNFERSNEIHILSNYEVSILSLEELERVITRDHGEIVDIFFDKISSSPFVCR